MAYIAPNTVLKILKAVPLDSSYQHTTRYPTKTHQYGDFEPHTKYNLTANTYQRVKKGVLRVSVLADNLYDCNYLMFQNSNFGTKWFYAFIDKVEYINNATSEIYYTIDVMQTFFFDYDIPACFIEREHALTDEIGDNVVPESIGMGDKKTIKNLWSKVYTDLSVVIKYVPNTKVLTQLQYNSVSNEYRWDTKLINDYELGFYQYGLYNGCWDVKVPNKRPHEPTVDMPAIEKWHTINVTINQILEDQGKIVEIVMFPTALYDAGHAPRQYSNVKGDGSQASTIEDWIDYLIRPVKDPFDCIEGEAFYNEDGTQSYVPKNRKLYTAPFSELVVTNNSGQTAKFEWEKFDYIDPVGAIMKRAMFQIEGSCDPSPEMIAYPEKYNGIYANYESGLAFSQFFRPSWSEDTFTKWWETNREAYGTAMITSLINQLTTFGKHAATQMPIQSAIEGVGTGIEMMTNIADRIGAKSVYQNMPDQLYGQSAYSGIQSWQRRIGFYFYDMGLELDVARSVDDFFTKYGYAQNKIAVPEIKNPLRYDNPEELPVLPLRPFWNYIKTMDCVISPKHDEGYVFNNVGLSSEDKRKIQSIYDNGITFWGGLDGLGDYSSDNSIRPY